MKKLLSLLLLFSITLGFSQRGYRYSIIPGTDNRYTIPYKEIKAITYAASKTVAPTQEETTYDFAQLTGNLTAIATITPCYTGDRMTCLFVADGTDRVVTFSTGFSANGTLTVPASTRATVSFVFNGSAWKESTRQTSYLGAFNTIAEATSGSGVSFSDPIIRNQNTATAYTSTSTITATELSGGLISVTSGTLTLTLPTATNIGTSVGAGAGTIFDFVLQNSASGGIATLAVNTGITASTFPSSNTLTLSPSATTGIAVFRLTFISSTVATLTRLN